MPNLTRRGARNVTADLDRLATLFQERHATLGLPKKIALDFAYRCDLLADHVERHAVHLAGDESEEKDEKPEETEEKDESEKDEKPEEKKASRKAADGSVEPAPGNQGFNANDIAEPVPGPDEILPPVESWMSGHFTQDWFQELQELQQAGTLQSNAAKHQILTKVAVNERVKRLRRLASVSQLSVLQDVLKALQARLSASGIAEVKSLATEVGKQVAAVGKVRDTQIEQQVAGPADAAILIAAERIVQVLSEEIPALKGVAVAVDADSPTAVLEAQKSVGALKDLVSLSTSMINDAVKGISKVEKAEKVASKKAGDEKPEDDEKPAKDEKKEASKKKAGEDKPAEDDEKPAKDEKKEASKKKADEEKDDKKDEDEDAKVEKTAANDFGYALTVA